MYQTFCRVIAITAAAVSVDAVAQWPQFWNLEGDQPDYAVSVVRDHRGNIIVAGSTLNWPTEQLNIYVRKYSPSGTPVWGRPYDLSFGVEIAVSVGVDASNNVYVCGYGYNSGYGKDAIVVKYNEGGDLQWAKTDIRLYSDARDDEPVDMAVTPDGYVYIAGRTSHPTIQPERAIFTARVNPDGTLQEIRGKQFYHEGAPRDTVAEGIAVDANKKVTVVGWSKVDVPNVDPVDWALVHYNGSLSTEEWSELWDPTTGQVSNYAYDVDVDAAGNIYVTGNGYVEPLAAQEAVGVLTQSWTEQHVVRWDADGAGWWGQIHADPTEEDSGLFVKVRDNLVFVTGRSKDRDGTWDIVTFAHAASNGASQNGFPQIFPNLASGVSDQDEEPTGFAVAGRSLYICGWQKNVSNSSIADFLGLRYLDQGQDPTGWLVWDGPGAGNLQDIARGVAITGGGMAHITGYVYTGAPPAGRFEDYATLQFFGRVDNRVTIAPDSYTIVRGIPISGNLASVASSDDDRLVVQKGLVFGTTEWPVTVEFTGPIDPNEGETFSLSELVLRVECSVLSGQISCSLEFWNFDTESWDVMDQRDASSGTDDIGFAISIPNPARYRKSTSSEHYVKCRIRFRPNGPVSGDNWQARMDRVNWEVMYN